ncbi:DUF4105 domain-containing protein [Achromobacter arsenitoxydans]|uniref:Lnb N-terminal periplasmic domain-containing protein n=1 Tax=Achromobacter arsenitoxydans SY8 TaxID=477184 RepID=H0F6X8_9BURK|nr:DUF4105 domain-containing protein [Achromobacter arsenitoxydans]EHK66036.1 hypothetical protein KYC_12943 [Achromobacter arsenitoxydans SY8]
MTVSILQGIAIALVAAWGALALWIRAPLSPGRKAAVVLAWVISALAALGGLAWQAWRPGLYLHGAALAALLWWWLRIRPSNDRPWTAEVSRQTRGEVSGHLVTLHNVRNFDWRSRTDFTPKWETRRYCLDALQSVDVALSYWGHPAIAHALMSFGFADDDHVVFSVEIRRKQGDKFSEIGGFFKQYELSVIASTEEDSLRVRTNVRGEDGYLYRIHMPEGAARALFLAYVDKANRLVAAPRFYHTLTANCTTIVFQMARRIVPGLPLDYRQLLSGYLPEYLYKLDALRGAGSAAQYRQLGRYTDRALATYDRAQYSRNIRRGVPGIARDDHAPRA